LLKEFSNYHLRELEKHGLIEQLEERKKGNCVERIVRATARHYLISPEALGNLASDPGQIQDRFSSTYLVAVAARAIRDLAVLRTRAEKAGKKLATFTLETNVRFASAADQHAFAEELANAVEWRATMISSEPLLFRPFRPQPGQAGTKQERAIGIRILRIARIKNLMV
jgi:hypothetical protein